MNELRIVFATATDTSYRACLTDVEGHELGVEVPLAPFLSEEDYEGLRWYLEDYMDLPDGGAVIRAGSMERRLSQWGRTLHDTIFLPGANRDLLDQLLAATEPRVLTVATRDSTLLRLPWELLSDDAGLLAQRLSIRRQLDEPEKADAREVVLPLRILYIVSRPSDTGFIDPRLTTKSLLVALDPLGGNVRVDFCRPPTLARMEEMLRDEQAAGDPYDLVHFDGHGTFMPDAQIGALFFEKADDSSGDSRSDLVRADRLGDLLAKYHIPLVVLEACRSATVGRTAVFRSVAPRLIEAGVGSVLSMGHAVHVEAARLLLDRFYRELVRGTTIGHAVAEGRSALRSTPVRWIESGPRGRTITLQDWFLPHLYQRGADEPLLPRDATAQQPVRQFDLFLSHNHNDSARVEQLARTLTEKHGLRVWLDKWECGPGRLEPQCEAGIADSRFTIIAGSQAALNSRWVNWEIDRHNELDPEGARLIPIKLEPLALPPGLDGLLWVDFTDPAHDTDNVSLLARLVHSADAEDARRRRGFRPPPQHGEPGAFPRPPQYGFQGRARELYELERRFRRHRGIVLHAMGGMGKTSLATEAADWWTRTGLFRDGACFLSFEQFTSADRVVQVLGAYCEGPRFDQRPATEQRRRVIEFFRELQVLIVWDNYESTLAQFNDATAAQAGPYTGEERRNLARLFEDLTTGPGSGCVLVTCRPAETGLPGAHTMELRGLARPDSLWLLHRILERDGLSLDDPGLSRERLDPLLNDLADHPLSLELVGPHLRTMTPEAIRADLGTLLRKFQQAAPEERNTSLLASLEFSRRHLSPAAREALPWLGLFSGGVFEDTLLDVTQIDPAAWEEIRAELEGTALLRTEYDLRLAGRPYLRFHPTLAIASADSALAREPETRARFVDSYLVLRNALDRMLAGAQARAALRTLNREEANYRTAARWAITDGRLQAAAMLGDTFMRFLQMSNRLRERDAWVTWLRNAITEGGFTVEAAEYERQHAWTLLGQGDPQSAMTRLQVLADRLRGTTEFDPTFQLATTLTMLGRVFIEAGSATEAIRVLREAISLWESLVIKKSGGQPWDELLSTGNFEKAPVQLGNLASAMGDLGTALRIAGELTEALTMAEEGLRIHEVEGNPREIAASSARCASILLAAGRFDEADVRYESALAATRQIGDKELEGTILQHQGLLARNQNQLERAARLYQQALQRFQEANDTAAVMQTYNLIGVVEEKAGRLPEARAWYEKSRDLARQLNDQVGLGQIAQNLGGICQSEGEAARARGDEAAARRHFEEGRRYTEESLRIKQAYDNKSHQAAAWGLLARLDLLLGDLTAAERHAHEARRIREPLGVPEVGADYHTLSEIAQARGDRAAAAEWTSKRDALREELKRRAGGEGGRSAQLLQTLEWLVLACAQAGFGGAELQPAMEEQVAQLERLPTPLSDFAASLRQLAAGELPAISTILPAELQQLLNAITKAISEAQQG